jgi:hypothetical protein
LPSFTIGEFVAEGDIGMALATVFPSCLLADLVQTEDFVTFLVFRLESEH